MRTIDLHHCDTFTSTIFQGNPSAVITNSDSLSDEEMMAIAEEINLDETTFVLSPTNGISSIKFRFFTPNRVEIDFTGHGTVGGLYELARLKKYGLGQVGLNKITVETNTGSLTAWTKVDANSIEVIMGVPKINLVNYELQSDKFARAFGIPKESLFANKPILLETNLKYLYIPIIDLTALGNLKFDFNQLKQTFKNSGIVLFCLYTPSGFDKDGDIHSRVIAPLIGFDSEDPFTGSVQAVVCVAAKQLGLFDKNKIEFNTEQGDFVKSPGRAKVTFDSESGEPFVSSHAVHVFSATINI